MRTRPEEICASLGLQQALMVLEDSEVPADAKVARELRDWLNRNGFSTVKPSLEDARAIARALKENPT